MPTAPARKPLRLLLVEDSPSDEALVLMELRRAGFDPIATRVETPEAMREALRSQTWDLILADYNLPSFTGLEALGLYRESGLDLPFFIVSGTIGEGLAVEAMRAGAHDYLIKDNLARLGPAIVRELRETQLRRERKQDLDRLIASERQFTTIFNNSPVAIIVTSLEDGTIFDVNPAALALFGYTRAEALGHRTIDFGAYTDLSERRRLIRQALAGGLGSTIECRVRTKAGNFLSVLIAFSLIEYNGETRLLAMMQDISARQIAETTLRDSEERFRLLVENSNDLVCEVDVQGTYLYVSPNHERITGYTVSEKIGHSVFESIHPDDMPSVMHQFRTRDAKFRYRHRHKNGSWLWFESSGRAYRTSSGQERGVIVTRDVSDTVRAEEARHYLESQLRQAQKMEAIGTLAGGIAHDFNNILTGIVGNVQLAELDLPNSHPSRVCLTDALAACARAKDLVAQILTFSRRREQQRGVARLGLIAKEALRLLRASLPATIEIRIEIGDHGPPILCDPSQIHQVIMNLGTNAAHAMRTHGGVLTVTLTTVTVDAALLARYPKLPPGNAVCLSMRDTGCGMDKATLERIFEPFFTTKGPGEGTGLGLAVVHGIVVNHDGGIGVESTVGQGTTFHLYFPVVETAAEESSAQQSSFPRGRGERIILVDDESAIAQIGQRMLSKLGYQAKVFTSSVEALEYIRQDPSRVDLVLTDLTMPEMTGVEFAHQVHLVRSTLPIILTSGFLRPGGADAARELGVRCFMEKPFTLGRLAEAIQQVLPPP
ncbi:MAG: PAS domain S-box protein [Opitutae bacterium]|nr:PAS domain S-box protein [Opitutae bacterium]